MPARHLWLNNVWLRVLQHLAFWIISFFIFLSVFKIGFNPEKIDYVYTIIFHLTILPAVYINLFILIPSLRKTNRWIWYFIQAIIVILLFSFLNESFFRVWSNKLMPDYFFISYFSFIQVCMFFVAYLVITSLLKFSKSWFVVNEMQKELLLAEKIKSVNERELLDLEAKALRAQMNPHFIFNCLNSIKSLIQDDQKDKSVLYLTTFSKLIRTLFNNADSKDISLYDEMETCRLYLQLESLRFDSKFSYSINIDEKIDLKSVQVPALIIQPFIENAIWHGIIPKGNDGHIDLEVHEENHRVQIMVDDDGIGREASQKHRSVNGLVHHSKGVHVTQSRLELNNSLQRKNAFLEIIDKKDEKQNPAGTKVILTFNQAD